MTNTMKEFTAAKMLTAAIKNVMGERYDKDKTVAANVAGLMRGEKEVKSDFQSPTEFPTVEEIQKEVEKTSKFLDENPIKGK